jgi:hypothetical protein
VFKAKRDRELLLKLSLQQFVKLRNFKTLIYWKKKSSKNLKYKKICLLKKFKKLIKKVNFLQFMGTQLMRVKHMNKKILQIKVIKNLKVQMILKKAILQTCHNMKYCSLKDK